MESISPHLASISGISGIIAGLVLLFLGRKLFWIFVGIIGFLAGMQWGARFAQGQPETVILLIALGIGLLGALLAILLQRVAVAIAGGLAGGMLAMRFAALLGITAEPAVWIAFAVGAILAALLVSFLFDWALIVLSSLTGAAVLARALPLGSSVELVVLVVLAIIGIVVQARLLRGRAA